MERLVFACKCDFTIIAYCHPFSLLQTLFLYMTDVQYQMESTHRGWAWYSNLLSMNHNTVSPLTSSGLDQIVMGWTEMVHDGTQVGGVSHRRESDYNKRIDRLSNTTILTVVWKWLASAPGAWSAPPPEHLGPRLGSGLVLVYNTMLYQNFWSRGNGEVAKFQATKCLFRYCRCRWV